MDFQNRVYVPLLDGLLDDEFLQAYPNATPSGQSEHIQRLNFDACLKTGGFSIRDTQAADCCVSGIWLLHNYLDQSHSISQQVHTAEGSWWHGIMHRMEGDFGNSKYWYRSVGVHPAFERIGQAKNGTPNWDPYDFVDQCRTPTEDTMRIARLEWQILFDHCFGLATGSSMADLGKAE